ncbi:MAG: MFS transporter [Alphaproteobacteria bacterium]|nr:MFS transporter [Alphaproteobacteria bacterium]
MTDFSKLLAAYAATQLGDQITLLALPLVAALVLGVGPAEMGWLAAAATAPFFVFGLPAGVWIDRLPRRSVMMVADLSRALALLAVPAATLLDTLSMPLLLAAASLAGTGTVFVDVASQSYVPSLVGRDRLIHANSRFEVGRAAAASGGPGLAGLLSGLIGPGLSVLASALAALVAVAFTWRIVARDAPAPAVARRAFAIELKEGVEFLLREPRLRALALCALTWNVSWFALGTVLVLHAARNLGLSALEIGLVFAVDGIGMVLGALFAPAIERRIGLGRAIVLGPTLCALGVLPVLAATPASALPLLAAGRFLFGFGPMVFSVTQTSLRQSVTPTRLLGRVNASLRWLTWGFRPLGAVLGGLAGEVLGLHAGIALAGLGLALCLVPLVVSPVPGLQRLQA